MAAIEKIVEGDGVITVYFNLSISQSHILLAGLLQLPLRGGGGQSQEKRLQKDGNIETFLIKIEIFSVCQN